MIVNANFGVFEIIALINIFVRDAGGTGGNMASYFGRQQSVASMASLPPDEVEFSPPGDQTDDFDDDKVEFSPIFNWEPYLIFFLRMLNLIMKSDSYS